MLVSLREWQREMAEPLVAKSASIEEEGEPFEREWLA